MHTQNVGNWWKTWVTIPRYETCKTRYVCRLNSYFDGNVIDSSTVAFLNIMAEVFLISNDNTMIKL